MLTGLGQTGTLLFLSLAYAAIAALLLNLNLSKPQSKWIRIGAILLVSGLYIGTWYGYQSTTGWASSAHLPDSFRVLWITIDEPDKAGGEPGHIYYWIRHLDEAGLPDGAPRAHSIDWQEAAAKAAQDALAAMSEGEQVNGRLSRNLISAGEPPVPGDNEGYSGEQAVSGAGGGQPEIEFIRVPPRELPAKPPPGSDY